MSFEKAGNFVLSGERTKDGEDALCRTLSVKVFVL